MDRTPSKTGGTAFPITEQTAQGDWDGLTKRDYFAAAAMTGLMANPATAERAFEILAERSYRIADEMLRVRNR